VERFDGDFPIAQNFVSSHVREQGNGVLLFQQSEKGSTKVFIHPEVEAFPVTPAGDLDAYPPFAV
jgi:hypothetical protein